MLTRELIGRSAWPVCLALAISGRSVFAQTADTPPMAPTVEASGEHLTFELDVQPILTASGCNSGACHGKARGQNGFQLSLLGFDADFDYQALVKDARGRRLFPADPDNSLLLRKATAELPHGGGKRFGSDSPEYATLRAWISAGMPRSGEGDPVLNSIAISPPERVMANNTQQQLTVTARYSDGSEREVTRLCDFQSNESAIVAIERGGLVKAGSLPGEATIMARFMGQIATWNTAIPLAGEVDAAVYEALPRRNFIDGLVWEKLQKLHIVPSEPAADTTFLRRATLDVLGRLPTPEEVREFVNDGSPDKRDRLVDRLLEQPGYADHWANKWVDLLRPNPYRVGIKATLNFDHWIREAFRKNLPYDQFVRQLVTAKGSTWHNGATTLFRDRRSADELTTMVSQLFLGIRLECAKCHHHPFEVWGQDDFYSLAAYFARVNYKGSGLSPPISGGQEFVFAGDKGQVAHPLTGKILEPRPLFGTARQAGPDEDPREVLADWMISAENDYFAQVAVNRVWAELMGRGLVDPVDDLRATNPPSNPALLTALAVEFRRQQFDLKKLIRTIMTSHVYGLSSIPNERNVADTRNYSRHYRQRLRAEVLLDAVCEITGTRESFAGMPPGSRAMEVWTFRSESLFLDTFGRPDPNQDPPCERTPDTTVSQTLHLMNAPNLHSKITSDQGRMASLAASDRTSEQLVEEVYVLAYSRFPSAEEQAALAPIFAADRRRALEDLLWALINTPEFLFKD